MVLAKVGLRLPLLRVSVRRLALFEGIPTCSTRWLLESAIQSMSPSSTVIPPGWLSEVPVAVPPRLLPLLVKLGCPNTPSAAAPFGWCAASS